MKNWQLTPAPCHQVRCCKCGWKRNAEGISQQAIAELKRLGWQIKSDGPWCPECVFEDEMSRDDSVVYPK